MFAIASTSSNSKNNVRAHVVKYNKKEHFYSKGALTVVQVDTQGYRELHRLMSSDISGLMNRFTQSPHTHKVDVPSLTLHTMDCAQVSDDYIIVSLKDAGSTGLNICSHCMPE